jgi:urease accessory protein
MHDPKLNSLLSALHLASPALPVGGFAYSQGLEQAIEDRWVTDKEQAYAWIRDGLLLNLARQELPWWLHCYEAASQQQWDFLIDGNQQLSAMRETAELRLESVQMGYSMARLFAQWPLAQVLVDLKGVTWSYPAAYASLAACTGVEKETALTAYLWSWVENQVLAAMKIVPLGQVEGQELLHRLKEDIPAACLVAQSIRITEAGSAAFGLALTSTRHETQYSRLFRS